MFTGMFRRMTAAAAAMVLIGACGGSSSNEREVLVDYSSDEFAMFLASNFPRTVSVVPGQTVVFKQTWTGEPHTVTGGTSVDETFASLADWFDLFTGYEELIPDNPDLVNPEEPGDATLQDFAAALKAAKPASKRDQVLRAYRSLQKEHAFMGDIDNPSTVRFEEIDNQITETTDPLFSDVLFAFNEEEGNLAQNVSHPCYLESGAPPEDTGEACSEAQQEQPAFDGTQTFYNSGILPYEGPRENTFEMEIAEDTKPGTYYFYCAVHGPGQLSEVQVRKPGTDVPSAGAVRRKARADAEKLALPLEKTYRDAVRTNSATVEGIELTGPFAGLPTTIHGSINEFVPRTIRAKAGEPITWRMIGADHTISFDVPPYLPIIQFGTKIRLNSKVSDPAGGAPPFEHEEDDAEAPGPPTHDAGTYDGEGFWSSGLVGAGPYLSYILRISKPGTYPYACLIHPKMIGTVVIT
jgi:plastocyanin